MKNPKFWLKASILLYSMMQMSNMCITSVLAEISASFPTADPAVIQMLSSYPCLVTLVLSVFNGAITARCAKKRMMQISCLLLLISGVGGFFFHGTLLVCFLWETVLGAGLGILIPTVVAVIAEQFDGQEKSALMGVQSSFVGLGGVILTLLGSVLGTMAWHYNFLAMLLAVPAFLAVTLKFPYQKPAIRETGKKGRPEWGTAMFYFTLGLLFLSFYNTIPSNASMYLDEIGKGSPLAAGACTASALLGSMFSGLLFGRLVKRLGKWLYLVGLSLLAAGLFLVPASTSLPLILLACFLGGSSLSIVMASNSNCVSQEVAPENVSATIGIVMAGSSSGGFASSLYTKFAAMAGITLPSQRYVLIGVCAAVLLAVMAVILIFQNRKKKPAC